MMTKEEFVNRVTDLIKERNTVEALELLKADFMTTEKVISKVIYAVAPNLTNSMLEDDKATYDCCSNILTFMIENCEPAMVAMDLSYYVQTTEDHLHFCTILNAMHSCLMRIEDKSTIIHWYADSIKTNIDTLPLPDDADDPEAACDKIILVYKTVLVKLEPLVQEAIDLNSILEKQSHLGNYLLGFLIRLCGKPFCCMNKYIGEETAYKELADNIVTQALRLTKDMLYFVDIVNKRERKLISLNAACKYRESNMEAFLCNSILSWTNNISNMAFANFYFYVITKENNWINLPQVYSSYYILETCAYYLKILLLEDHSISTGLIFMEHVVKRIPLGTVSSDVLKLEIYTDLFPPLTEVMIYSNSDKQRKKAVCIFQNYIEIFDTEAKYAVFFYLYEIVQHSGLLSFIAGMVKSSIIQCLESTPRNPQFLGKNLELLLKKICELPHGSSTDLVEISDEIITALNLLRFLFIRDKNNETGIWNMTDMLSNDFLNPLRDGIDLCRAHWRVKTKDLEQQKKDLGFRRLWTCRALLADQSENDNRKAESQQSIHEENDEEYEKNIKLKILGASLKFVPDMGWSKQAISAGAESIGYPGVIHGLFPNGSAALVQYFYTTCNRQLNQVLEKEALAIETNSSSPRKTPEQQVRDAVETRLRMVIPYKKIWPQAMAIMSLPPHVPTALANLLTLVDDICYYAGDRSVDINWYTRRMIVATIYKATELYMLQDTSEDHKDTWLFLERRIKDTLQVQTMLFSSTKSSPDALNRVAETATAVFITARNILGLN